MRLYSDIGLYQLTAKPLLTAIVITPPHPHPNVVTNECYKQMHPRESACWPKILPYPNDNIEMGEREQCMDSEASYVILRL